MSQIPPNEHDGMEGRPENGNENPYARRDVPDAVDLDSETPYLRADDVQRLNRKALIFLALIVLLLGGIGLWAFSGGLSGPPEPPRQQVSERVVIPAAPRDVAVPEPIVPPQQALPPLPVVEDDEAQSGMGMPDLGMSDSNGPSLLERRMQDAGGEGFFGGNGNEGQDPSAMAGMPGLQQTQVTAVDGPTSVQPLYKPSTLMLRGTYIRCVLQSRVISDFPGYTSCIVTEPVYSVDGQRLLLPRGSKIQGSYDAGGIIGDRIAIVWDRITTPTGLDINMQSPGVDALGAAGNPGHYSAHWAQRITSSLLISLLADGFKYAGEKNGPVTTEVTQVGVIQNPYESITAKTMERLANMALERNMARPPTVTINQGTIINVYVARDVDFSSVIH